MGSFKRLFVVVLAAGFATTAQAESWLCIADMSTGFDFNKSTQHWEIARFNVSDNRYVISAQVDNKTYPYRVSRFGSDQLVAVCKDGFTATTFLNCSFIGERFAFNKRTLRYQLSYEEGYINPTPGINDLKEGDDTPNIEIGRCSAL